MTDHGEFRVHDIYLNSFFVGEFRVHARVISFT
jgi:hypothetical protein